MRRLLPLLLLMLMMSPSALAWEDYTVYPKEDNAPDSVTYCDNLRGGYVDVFTIGGTTYDYAGEYIEVTDASGLMTFFRTDEGWPDVDTAMPDIMAYAAALPEAGERVFTFDGRTGTLTLADGTVHALPGTSEIVDYYDRGSRLFLTLDTEAGAHWLCIVPTNGGEPYTKALPFSGYFDSYHVGPEDDTVLYLSLDTGVEDDYFELAFYWNGERWTLGTMKNYWEVIDFDDYAICRDTDFSVTFGHHTWHDLETLDFSTLPHTFTELAAMLTHEGWRFAAQDLTLLTSPDANAEPATGQPDWDDKTAPAVCPADTPLCLLGTEGDWAKVGLHLDDLDYAVGYVPMSMLLTEPINVIPGGEAQGWFYTMTVEDGVLYFRTPSEYFPIVPIEVERAFADAARDLYREKGYSATPMRFDPDLYDLVKHFSWTIDSVRDMFLTDTALVTSCTMSWLEGNVLEIIHHPTDEHPTYYDIKMPAPFTFDREDWPWCITPVFD